MSQIWMKPVTTPKAWRGETLAREASWVVTLSDAEIATAQDTPVLIEAEA